METNTEFRGDTDCHPFWHIRRSSCVTECNCDMVEVAITTEKIAAGQELVVREAWFPRLFGSKRVINALSEQAPSAKKGRM